MVPNRATSSKLYKQTSNMNLIVLKDEFSHAKGKMLNGKNNHSSAVSRVLLELDFEKNYSVKLWVSIFVRRLL